MNIVHLIEKRNNFTEIQDLVINLYHNKYNYDYDFFASQEYFPNILAALRNIDIELCCNPLIFYGVKHGVFQIQDVPKNRLSVPFLESLSSIKMLEQIPLSDCLDQMLEIYDFHLFSRFVTIDGMVTKIMNEWTTLNEEKKAFIIQGRQNLKDQLPRPLVHFIDNIKPKTPEQIYKKLFNSLSPQEWQSYVKSLTEQEQKECIRYIDSTFFYPLAIFDIRKNTDLKDLITIDTLASDLDQYYETLIPKTIPCISYIDMHNTSYNLSNVIYIIKELYIESILSSSVQNIFDTLSIDYKQPLVELIDKIIHDYAFEHKKFSYYDIFSVINTTRTLAELDKTSYQQSFSYYVDSSKINSCGEVFAPSVTRIDSFILDFEKKSFDEQLKTLRQLTMSEIEIL